MAGVADEHALYRSAPYISHIPYTYCNHVPDNPIAAAATFSASNPDRETVDNSENHLRQTLIT